MGKQSENKSADQLRSNCEADQRLCFPCTDSTIPPKFTVSSHLLCFNQHQQPGLCRTCSQNTLLVFPRGGSNLAKSVYKPHCAAVEMDHHPLGRIEGEGLRMLNTDHVLPELWTDEGGSRVSCVYVHPYAFRLT